MAASKPAGVFGVSMFARTLHPGIRLVKPRRFCEKWQTMCGRYRLTNAERYGDFNDVRLGGTEIPARFNIAPTQTVFVILDESPKQFSPVKWGLIPSWAKDRKIASSLINARCETVATKPAFRTAFKKRRCLVPADGFFEWQKVGAAKQPFNIGLKDDEPFAFAGLWEWWRDPLTQEELKTCSIITTTPNELTAPIHNRMPVILPMDRRAAWLDPARSLEELQTFLVPFDASKMEAYPIAARVGSPKHDDAGIIERLLPLAPELPFPNSL
jgi:putative SOS response-associated peptidase YedK